MKVKTEKIKGIIEVSKQILASHKKFEKFRDGMADFDLSQKRRDSLRNKMEAEAEYIEDRFHELHCLCVEARLAKYEEERYNDKQIKTSNGWGRLEVLRRSPVL